jgi:hypothetical protein
MACNLRGYHRCIPMICTRYFVIIQQDRTISCSHFVIYNLSTTVTLRNNCKLKRLVYFVDISSIHVHEETHRWGWTISFYVWRRKMHPHIDFNVSWRFERVQFISYDRRLLDRNMLLLWNNDTFLMYPISGWSIIRYSPQLVHNRSLSWYKAAANKSDYLPSEKRWIHWVFICRGEDVRIAR